MRIFGTSYRSLLDDMLDGADSDAASLVRTIMKSVQYIHDAGIVHRGMFRPWLACRNRPTLCKI